MKATVITLAKVAAKALMLSLAVGLANSAQAQSVRLPGEETVSSSLSLTTELDPRAASRSAMDAGVAKRAAMTSTSVAISQELPKAVEQALSMLSIEKLMEGESKAIVIVGGGNSLVEEQAVNVKVNFEERPVGGILTVRASMAPTFRGVGVATRPVVSRSIAMAVDELDQSMVNDLVRELTAEINQEFAHN